jgi:cyclopropane fatty-acyl-phospholipid synthase-like methyltransferase
MRKTLFVLAAACGSSPPQHHDHAAPHEHGGPPHEHGGHPVGHRFEHADDWAKTFDDPSRDAWQKPDAVVAALALSPGMTVADVGAGTGYFEKRLATAVGANGMVFAVDIEPDMVRYLGERAAREGTPNVEPRLGKADDPTLAAASVDRILVVDTWHHIGDRAAYAKKLAAALKPGGFVLIVDFTLESEKGPPKTHRLASDTIAADLTQGGLRASVIAEDLPDQYIVKGER